MSDGMLAANMPSGRRKKSELSREHIAIIQSRFPEFAAEWSEKHGWKFSNRLLLPVTRLAASYRVASLAEVAKRIQSGNLEEIAEIRLQNDAFREELRGMRQGRRAVCGVPAQRSSAPRDRNVQLSPHE